MSRKGHKRGGDGYLNGRLLIAMPTMNDPNFEKTVVLLCHHTPETAMGIVINKAMGGMSFERLLKQLKVEAPRGKRADLTVHYGGPIQTTRGFVLHSDDYHSDDSTLKVCEGIALTATMDVLKALGHGEGPAKAFFALGYAGWGAGQLESELQDNAWLIGEPDEAIVFGDALDAKWRLALTRIGVDPAMVTDATGHA
jgi:putative transcriptional regulator